MIYTQVPQINFLTQVIEHACGDLMYRLGELLLLQNSSNRLRVCRRVVHCIDYRIKKAILKAHPQAVVINHPDDLAAMNNTRNQTDSDTKDRHAVLSLKEYPQAGVINHPDDLAAMNNTRNQTDSDTKDRHAVLSLQGDKSVRKFSDIKEDTSWLGYDNYQASSHFWPISTQDSTQVQDPMPPLCFIAPHLEGSHNLERGGYEFSVSLGILTAENLECAVVYLPVRNDLFWTSRNKWSFLHKRRIRPTDCHKYKNQLSIHEFNCGSFNMDWATMIFKLRKQKHCRVQSMNHLSGSLMYLSMGCIDVLITNILPTFLPAYLIAKHAGVTVQLLTDNCYLLGSASNVKIVRDFLL